MEKKKICIKEVGPRDGFQMEKNLIPTELKIAVIDKISESGIEKIQFTAFMHPKAVPNMADAERVATGIRRNPNVLYQALVANQKGYERAAAAEISEVEFTLSATNSHNISNVNATTEDSFRSIRDSLKLGGKTKIVGGVAVAFGCPFEGRPPLAQIDWILENFLDLSIREVTLADTAGVGDPTQVYSLFSHVLQKYPDIEFCFHPHNTHNTAIANVFAAIRAGVRNFDSSVAGLGGCPFSPGASGNISTEDLVDILSAAEYETGIDLDVVLDAARMAKSAAGHSDSATLKAGRIGDLVKGDVKRQNNKY